MVGIYWKKKIRVKVFHEAILVQTCVVQGSTVIRKTGYSLFETLWLFDLKINKGKPQ